MKRWLVWLAAAVLLLLAACFRRDLAPEELTEYLNDPADFVEVDGLKVHYRAEGPVSEKPPLVLLHGTSSSLHTWDGWAAALGSEHRVVRPDLPGFGLTGPNEENRYTPATDVAFLDAFLDRLGLETVTLGGSSLGGIIALYYTLERRERVSSLILVDSAGLPHPPLGMDLLTRPGLALVARWFTPRLGMACTLRQVYGDERRVSDRLVRRYHRLFLRRGNRAAHIERRRNPHPWVTARVGEIGVPTLILWGERDPWIAVDTAHEFRSRIADSKLVTYCDLGHLPMEEAPRLTARAVRSFLDGSLVEPLACVEGYDRPAG